MKLIRHLTTKHSTVWEPITPRLVVLHDTDGTDSLHWLADNPDAICSVTYLVARDGTVYQIGEEWWSTWHAGRTVVELDGVTRTDSANHFSIGIEIEHLSGRQDYPVPQLDAVDELIAGAYARWPIAAVTSHKAIAWPRGRKVDPELDVREFTIEKVRARLGIQQKGWLMALTDAEQELVLQLTKENKVSSVRASGRLKWLVAKALGQSAAALEQIDRDSLKDTAAVKRKLGLALTEGEKKLLT